ncbi:iron transporter [Trichoderma arundinaceum]|uniref:Solute carrier family 40 member n=1 Tax=Trichoderma arundinaceum TaxID=490622 RepID=A0A395NQN1_TRIAR|nr:iron transporter [Trichoderma arundinaceum]
MASDDERTALLGRNAIDQDDSPGSSLTHYHVPASVARRLYVSHFLSTWNSRVFEFGAVLYLAAVFPGTLLPMSLYALVRGLSAIVFAPMIGWYIDTGNRLQVVRVSIVSVEKDWVVVVSERNPEALQAMNSQMRRIDLLCKLFGPLFIAVIDAYSSRVAIIVNFAMNAASVAVEYVAIARVYYEVPELQQVKTQPQRNTAEAEPSHASNTFIHAVSQRLVCIVKTSTQDFALYVRHKAFLASFAGAILYFTVLSFGGQMVTYLLSAGYSSMQVGIARTLGVIFEVSATWAAPWLMGRIGAIRAGLWMSSWQVIMLLAGVSVFWAFDTNNSLISASGLVGGTILSRLGLRGFDLCVQLIVQEEVEAESRGVFSSVEAAWQNAFELLAYASTIIFSRPEQFKWPSLISAAAVASASSAYATFVYIRRGHLLHLEALTNFLRMEKGKQRDQERGIDRTSSESEIIGHQFRYVPLRKKTPWTLCGLGNLMKSSEITSNISSYGTEQQGVAQQRIVPVAGASINAEAHLRYCGGAAAGSAANALLLQGFEGATSLSRFGDRVACLFDSRFTEPPETGG